MAPNTITLSPEQCADMLTAALSLYSVKADALQDALDRYLEDRQSVEELAHHRSEIAALERILDQLGWDFTAEQSVQLAVGPDRALVFELVHDAYGHAIENLATVIGTPAHPVFDIEQARSQLRYADSLLGLVAAASLGTDQPARTPAG
jgi:hypothetical protein